MLFDTIYNFINMFHNENNSNVATLDNKQISLKWYKEGGCLIVRNMDNNINIQNITNIMKTIISSSYLREHGLQKIRLDYIYNSELLKQYEKEGWTIVDYYVEMYP